MFFFTCGKQAANNFSFCLSTSKVNTMMTFKDITARTVAKVNRVSLFSTATKYDNKSQHLCGLETCAKCQINTWDVRFRYSIVFLTASMFLVAKSNSIRGIVCPSLRPWVRGSVRGSVRWSVGHAFLENKFNKIQQNSRLFATVARVTALF